MQIVLDTHTHTLASAHAYSTVLEIAQAAANRGLELLAITDHTPGLVDSPDLLHFLNLGVMDKELFGVEMLYGAELNIEDYKGAVSMEEWCLKRMDICIASFHAECLTPGTKAENTVAICGAMNNPYVNIIGHPNDAAIPLDYDAVAREAVKTGVMLEVNNATLRPTTHRAGTRETLIEMLAAAQKHGAYISLGTDTHFATATGNFDLSVALLQEIGFPQELVVSTSVKKFKEHLLRSRG